MLTNHTRQDQSLQNKLFQYSLIVSNIPYSKKPFNKANKWRYFIIEA
ncbi:hypothetical protein KVL03_03940 [Helicobacter pylori]|nr:hypothetical protein KVL03_03940 [Helicobacter pylori]